MAGQEALRQELEEILAVLRPDLDPREQAALADQAAADPMLRAMLGHLGRLPARDQQKLADLAGGRHRRQRPGPQEG